MPNDKKSLMVPVLVLLFAVCLAVFGTCLKLIAAAPGSASGLGDSAGDPVYVTSMLYENNPEGYSIPFNSSGIMGPYIGTVSGLNNFPGLIGTIAVIHLYYGYDWCSHYGTDNPNCRDVNEQIKMPLCAIVWTPLAGDGTSDNAYKACYVRSDGDVDKAWRPNYEQEDAGVQTGSTDMRNIQVLLDDLSYSGIAAIDN